MQISLDSPDSEKTSTVCDAMVPADDSRQPLIFPHLLK